MQGKTLGDYTIIKQIGKGALGTVCLAEHRFMKKQYALKILPPELSQDRPFIQRFEEEVGILTTLEHSNIVKVHNVSFSQGQYFLVTDCIVDEFGETTNLAQYLLGAREAMKEDEAYTLLMQIAEALDYAHQRIIHRGVKLNNILVSKGSRGINLYLSDFGLSKIVGTGAVLAKSMQIVAEAVGSKAYVQSGSVSYPTESLADEKITPLHTSFLQNFAFLAPEQKRLDGKYQTTMKADVYAFGILAYYLLMREFPEGYFPMPSEGIQRFKWDWDTLIQTCLDCNPENRPNSLVEALSYVKMVKEVVVPVKEIASIPHPVAEQLIEQTICHYQVEEQPILEPVGVCYTQECDNQGSNKLRPVIHHQQLERPEHDPDPAKIFEIDQTVKQYVPEKKEEKMITPILTEMVVIPGGTYCRGSTDGNRDEMPKHDVILTSFAMDIHPVTNEQFVRFLEAMGGEKDSHHRDIIRLRDSRIKRSGGRLSIESGYIKHPVVGVTWYGAVSYAKWVGKRLPTEAEWEIAASGGDEGGIYPTGDECEKSQANYFSADTTSVMSYPPGYFGLYDMAGNVYEWCQDWYGYNYYEVSIQEPECPKGPLQGVYRVLKGGCWKSLKEDLHCSRRNRNNPGTVNSTYGFRCAADVSE